MVEGCFDVAKLYEAGIKNVVATFGAHLTNTQAQRIAYLANTHQAKTIKVFFDRHDAGPRAQQAAIEALKDVGLEVEGFDWNQMFTSSTQSVARIPETITDPAEFSPAQLRWLRERRLI